MSCFWWLNSSPHKEHADEQKHSINDKKTPHINKTFYCSIVHMQLCVGDVKKGFSVKGANPLKAATNL